MKKQTQWCFAIMLAGMPFWSRAQLLKGKADGGIQELQVGISLDGDQGAMEYRPVELKEDGTFEFDTGLVSPFNDVMVFVDDNEIVGAHLEQGKTLELILHREKDGDLKYTFRGDNRGLSEFYTRFARAFDFMRYMPMDAPENVSSADYLALLEKEAETVKALLPSVTGTELNRYYTRLTEATEKSLRIRLLREDKSREKEYRELLASIDVNDEISMRSDLAGMYIHCKIPAELLAYGRDMTPWALHYMDTVDYYVTNPVVKKALVRNCAATYFCFGKGGDYMKFWDRFRTFAGDYPEIIRDCEERIAGICRTAKGTDAGDAVLQTPDGKTCKLSDFFGKLTYIDVWATWCGPCCAEIPHLEKLVERFKDNDKIQFISISVDTALKAWLNKLEKDKPAWAQFIFPKEEAARFMQAWGISGIPRFILIDRNGKIYAADAPRPSDEGLVEILEKAMNEE